MPTTPKSISPIEGVSEIDKLSERITSFQIPKVNNPKEGADGRAGEAHTHDGGDSWEA